MRRYMSGCVTRRCVMRGCVKSVHVRETVRGHMRE